MAINSAAATSIASLYIGFYDRAPDPVGLNYWLGKLADGVSLTDIAESFAASPEAALTYPYIKAPNLFTPEQMIDQVYQNVFGRDADDDGMAYYSARLEAGESVGSVLASIIGNAATNEDGEFPDSGILANKVEVGLSWAEQAGLKPGTIYEADGETLTPGANASAHGVIDGVDATDASVTEANGEITDYFNTGDIVTLTTGIDNVVGSDGNDTFTGVANNGGFANGETFTTGDTINGGTGVDTLKVVVTTADATVVPNLSNVENIDVQAFGANLTLNLATSTGVQQLSLSNGANNLTATNVGNIVDLALNNTTAGVLTATYAAATVAGLTDVQNIAVNSALGTVSVAGVETINITSEGAATTTELNTIGLTAGNLETLNIDGSGGLLITTGLANSVTTVDASASTGGVEVTLGVSDATVTGGSGDDTFNFGGNLTTADVVDGGEGFDTVSTSIGGNLSTAAQVAVFGGLTSIERVEFTAAAGVTLNGSTFNFADITNVQFNGAGNDVFNNASAARTIEFGTANGGTADIALAAGVTTLDLGLMGTQGTVAANDGNDADVGAVTITTAGVGSTTTAVTVNLTSNGDLSAVNFNDVGVVTVASGSSLMVDGDGNLDLAGFANNVTIDASALTGDLTVQGSAIALADVGSAGVGTATVLGQGVDAITLGSGANVVEFNLNGLDSGIIQFAGATAVANGNILVDSITGFGADDVLEITGGATNAYVALGGAVQTAIDALSGGAATLAGAANLAATANSTAGWTAFSFQGDTYALYENANDAANFANDDTLVHLVGVDVADLGAANFMI